MEVNEVELKFEINGTETEILYQKFIDKYRHDYSGYEISEMYDLNDLLSKNDARLRLRKTIDLFTNEIVTRVTYKKPLTRKGIKVELEHETTVGNYSKMLQILHSIGFERVSSYEKFRHSFITDNGTKLEIDIYPYATFLEIEGRKKEIIEYAEELGFSMGKNITDSCDTIDDKRRKSRGLPSRDDILFENVEKETIEQRKLIQNSKK